MTTTLGAGNVELKLGEETAVLRPTLRAAQTISKQSGGILAAIQAVARFDLDVMTAVIALGLNITTPKEINQVAEKIYATGMIDLVEPVTRYLTILANGGRPTVDGGEGGEHPPGS